MSDFTIGYLVSLIKDHNFKLICGYNDNGTRVYLFISDKGLGGDVLRVEYTEDADEEILDEIKGVQ